MLRGHLGHPVFSLQQVLEQAPQMSNLAHISQYF